jgi:hypothetical protein
METLTRVALALGACSVPLALMIGCWRLAYRHRQRQRLVYLARLRQARPTATRAQFVAWFVARGVRASVAATVYDELQRRCGVPDFPLLPDDVLARVCDVVVHEAIDELLQAMGYGALAERVWEHGAWEALDWDTLALLPPAEADAPIASLVHLIDALETSRRTALDPPAGGAT